jgi:pimeloyl-ACP methyl ester carboxylesterase
VLASLLAVAPVSPVSAESSTATGSTTFSLDQSGNAVYRVNYGFDLDRYMFRSDGPLDFSIEVPRGFGPVDANGHPVPGNSLFGKAGRLTLRAFDIDDDYAGTDGVNPERDVVTVNGTELAPPLSGADNQWSINTLSLPLNLLKLPTSGNPNGRNDFQVLIDTANATNAWAAEVDWAELRLSSEVLPVAMVHGFGGSSNDFSSPGGLEDYYVAQHPPLDGRTATPSLTTRGSIRENMRLLESSFPQLLEDSATYQLNVLAHSMGGLATRLYAWDHPEEVDKVVMLGTPNGGTRMADILCAARAGPFDTPFKRMLEDKFGRCNGPQDGLFQLQQAYVQKVFNKQVLDRPSTF